MHRHKTPFATVCGAPLAVFAIPLNSSETRLALDPGAKAQVGWEFLELKYRRFIHAGKLPKLSASAHPTGPFTLMVISVLRYPPLGLLPACNRASRDQSAEYLQLRLC